MEIQPQITKWDTSDYIVKDQQEIQFCNDKTS